MLSYRLGLFFFSLSGREGRQAGGGAYTYCLLFTFDQVDPAYNPGPVETRQVYGVSLEQRRNDAKIGTSLFSNVVSQKKEVCDSCMTLL
jgi:AICAR transformylase/IMP cyclohydrolase PurH